MKKILGSVVLGLVLCASPLAAAANKNTGCGLGSYIIDKQGIVWHVLQVWLNFTSWNQSFGITTGTLGCSKVSNVVMDARTQEFIASNMDALSKEIAQGKGENLDTLAELLQVEDAQAFKMALQANYNKLYVNKDVQMSDVLEGISAL